MRGVHASGRPLEDNKMAEAAWKAGARSSQATRSCRMPAVNPTEESIGWPRRGGFRPSSRGAEAAISAGSGEKIAIWPRAMVFRLYCYHAPVQAPPRAGACAQMRPIGNASAAARPIARIPNRFIRLSSSPIGASIAAESYHQR